MRPIYRAIPPIVLTGLFLLAGCGGKSSESALARSSGVLGTWTVSQRGATMTIVFRSDNTYTLTSSAMGLEGGEAGTYTGSGNQVTMTPQVCTVLGTPQACEETSATTATISGDQLIYPGPGRATILTKG